MSVPDEIARLLRAKAEIKDEIEGKGVSVPHSARLDTYDDYVRQIQEMTGPVTWGEIEGDIDDQTDLKGILDGKYEKPATGIPASDLADGVIPDVSDFITKTVNDLANYYLKSETYTQSEVDALIGAISQFHYEIAASTSAVASPASNVLYLIGPTGTGADKYEEYVYTNSTWVKIGDTSIDLSGYVTTTALNTILAGYVTSSALTTALADYVTSTALNTALAAKQDKIDAQHKLDYALLDNTPTIPAPQVQSNWEQLDDTAPDFIKNKPTIPPGSVVDQNYDATSTNAQSGVAMAGALSGKQDTISDLSAIRTGAGLGATAYQKPGTGIPASDLASGVIPEFTDYTDAELQTAIDTAFANL